MHLEWCWSNQMARCTLASLIEDRRMQLHCLLQYPSCQQRKYYWLPHQQQKLLPQLDEKQHLGNNLFIITTGRRGISDQWLKWRQGRMGAVWIGSNYLHCSHIRQRGMGAINIGGSRRGHLSNKTWWWWQEGSADGGMGCIRVINQSYKKERNGSSHLNDDDDDDDEKAHWMEGWDA